MKKLLLLGGIIGSAWPLLAGHFPLCMYGVDDPADLATLKKAGFTCIQSYQKEPEKLAPLARQAQKLGMQVVFHPQQVLGSAYQEQARNWPVLAWYIVDEPDVWQWSRARVQAEQDRVRQAFAAHSNALVIGQGRTATPYYDLPDHLMVDWYPVPHLPLTSFGDQVRYAKAGQTAYAVADRPLWGVVQTFNWKEYKQHRPDEDRIGRFPTQAEIRFMSYDGILNGATGLFYFIFTTEGIALPKAQPTWWAHVKAVSQEIARLRPVLEEGILTEGSLTTEPPLAVQARKYKNHLYLILLNRSSQPIAVPAELLSRKYKKLFIQKKTAEVAPFDVWVLKKKITDK
ncbi:MAG: hypothetical protein IKN49_06685 [Elusimicrobiaceae bacterium]|nr:hypothetical protein [Elusimicrobiaceae bacterium]